MDTAPSFFYLWLFLISFAVRFTRLIVNAVSYWTFQAIPVPRIPTVHPSDVTVIIPSTLSSLPGIGVCMCSIKACQPHQIILVVASVKVDAAKDLCKCYGLEDVKILGVPKLGKRQQLVRGLRHVKTPVTVLADDDVLWPDNYLAHLLAPLENQDIGACGTNQRVIRQPGMSLWNFLGIAYLERRNFNTGATCHIDGGISTLSGRTACYRTHILQDEALYDAFQNSTWLGQKLNPDDDKFLTRWVYSHGWKIHLQFTEAAVLHTTLESDHKFLHQCLRWARSHWRGNIDVVLSERYWFRRHPWTLYATYIGSLMTPSLAVDLYLYWTFQRALLELDCNSAWHWTGTCTFVGWILLTKMVKLIGHFWRYPADLIWLPMAIAFGYFHGFLNIYALCTMHIVSWGSKAINGESASPTPMPSPILRSLRTATPLEEVAPLTKVE